MVLKNGEISPNLVTLRVGMLIVDCFFRADQLMIITTNRKQTEAHSFEQTLIK